MLFAVNVLRLIESFPPTVSGQLIARQLAKCATSVASNYRAACIAQSRAAFIAKLSIVVEEADESVLWLELTTRAGILAEPPRALLRESLELRAIFGKSVGTARANRRQAARRAPNSTNEPISQR